MLGIFPLLLAIIFISLLILIIMESKKALSTSAPKNAFLRVYLLIISIIATAGATISLGFFIYPTIQKLIITDKEYLFNYREYKRCSEEKYTPIETEKGIIENHTKPIAEEISDCQEKVREEQKIQRSYEYKRDITNALSRLAVFCFLFLTHFPAFIRQQREK